jgi:hypothetical protein
MNQDDEILKDLSYSCEKLPEYAMSNDPIDFPKGAFHASNVTNNLSALAEHIDPEKHEMLHSRIEMVQYALKEIESFFTDRKSSRLRATDAYIFGEWVKANSLKIILNADALKNDSH